MKEKWERKTASSKLIWRRRKGKRNSRWIWFDFSLDLAPTRELKALNYADVSHSSIKRANKSFVRTRVFRNFVFRSSEFLSSERERHYDINGNGSPISSPVISCSSTSSGNELKRFLLTDSQDNLGFLVSIKKFISYLLSTTIRSFLLFPAYKFFTSTVLSSRMDCVRSV